MNKLLILTLSISLISSISAKDDYITTAITASSPDKIEGLVEAGYSVSWEKKEAYLELARQIVETAQKEVAALSVGKRPLLTNLELLTAAGIVSLTGKQLYDQYNDPKKENWKGNLVFSLAFLGLTKNLLAFVKDFSKKDDALKRLKDAKKVLELVDLIQID